MTTTTGGAMDLDRVEMTLAEFDALLDASSLGAPQVQAVREQTPQDLSEQLTARLADRSNPPPGDAPRTVTRQPATIGIDLGTTWSAPPPYVDRALRIWTRRTPHRDSRSHEDTSPDQLFVASDELDREGTDSRIAIPSGNRRLVFCVNFGLNDQPNFVIRGAMIPSRSLWLEEYLVRRYPTGRDLLLKILRRELKLWPAASDRNWPPSLERAEQAERKPTAEGTIGRFGMGMRIAAAYSHALARKLPLERGAPVGWFLGALPHVMPGSGRAMHQSDLDAVIDGCHRLVGVLHWRDGNWVGRMRTVSRPTPPGVDLPAAVGSQWNNTWWLRPDLDSGTTWREQCVSALRLTCWGNHGAKDNSGQDIPCCSRDRADTVCPALLVLAAYSASRMPAAPQIGVQTYPFAASGQVGFLLAQTWWDERQEAPDQHVASAHQFVCAEALASLVWSHHRLGRPNRYGALAWPRNLWDGELWELTVMCATLPSSPAPTGAWHEQSTASLPTGRERDSQSVMRTTAFPWLFEPSSSHAEPAHSVTTVRAGFWLLLLASPEPDPVAATFTYRSDDPYAVQVVFRPSAQRQVLWTFGRDLLREGLDGIAGSGDVQVWKADEQENSQAEPWVHIALRVPQGEAQLKMLQADLRQFLERTQAVIDHGSEHIHVQAAWERAAKDLLCRSTPAGTQDPDTSTDGRWESFTDDEQPEPVPTPGSAIVVPCARVGRCSCKRCGCEGLRWPL